MSGGGAYGGEDWVVDGDRVRGEEESEDVE